MCKYACQSYGCSKLISNQFSPFKQLPIRRYMVDLHYLLTFAFNKVMQQTALPAARTSDDKEFEQII